MRGPPKSLDDTSLHDASSDDVVPGREEDGQHLERMHFREGLSGYDPEGYTFHHRWQWSFIPPVVTISPPQVIVDLADATDRMVSRGFLYPRRSTIRFTLSAPC